MARSFVEYMGQETKSQLRNKHERNVYNAVVILLNNGKSIETAIERCHSAFGKVSYGRIVEIARLVSAN